MTWMLRTETSVTEVATNYVPLRSEELLIKPLGATNPEDWENVELCCLCYVQI